MERLGENGSNIEKRRAYLDEFRRIYPKSPEWEAWLDATGELPPDFDALPSSPEPPDLLTPIVDGQRITIASPEEWEAHRPRIRAALHHWMLGTVPPRPDDLRVESVEEVEEEGARVRHVVLAFGPEGTAKLRVEVLIPKGEGPFPVFMSQTNHRPWGMVALRRGYLVCLYAGCDLADDTDTFVAAYPEHDWSRLTRRAWAGGRALDYLETVPEADTSRVALTGHSRNGKQSLIAAAIDDRFALIISSSSGAGGAMTARDCGAPEQSESIDMLTFQFPDWFHPRLRFFCGREDRLPVDLHDLVALTAPRPLLLSTAVNDGVELTWAIQQMYLNVRKVYRLHGAEERIRILWRPGGHETYSALIERYLDWCDLHFGRGEYDFPERFVYPHDWEGWRKRARIAITPSDFPEREPVGSPLAIDGNPLRTVDEWERRRREIRIEIERMLGDPPPAARNAGSEYGAEPTHIAAMLGRGTPGRGVEKDSFVFGEDICGDAYVPEGGIDSGERYPTIIWLHGFSFARGYKAAYIRGLDLYRAVPTRGIVAVCFDQIGFGRRVEETEGFYERYPDWSLAGQMVRDTRAALDAALTLPYVDPDRVWVVGYALGAFVGLHAAALDDRFAGLIAVCGPQPFRLDTSERGTAGLRRWAHRMMLLPRLGAFVGSETRVPYDVPELLACLAPRPALVVSPTLDREARVEDVRRAVEAAREVYRLYGAETALEQVEPEDFNRFDPERREQVIEWLAERVGR